MLKPMTKSYIKMSLQGLRGPVLCACSTAKNFDLCILIKGTARPQSQFPQSCVCGRFIYSHERSTYFPAAEYVHRSWEYINRTQKHECKKWDYGRAVPFLGIYVSNFRYSIFAFFSLWMYITNISHESLSEEIFLLIM
jgi:hypothetical protein